MKKSLFCLSLVTVASLFLINVNLFASDTDDRIESSAKKSYVFKTYLKGDDIKIKSTDGVVALTGTVAEESHKSLARETVASLPGVKSVDNKLTVKGEVPAEHSDAWLITKVKTTLLFHRSVSATGTEVLAKDGTITLRGKADTCLIFIDIFRKQFEEAIAEQSFAKLKKESLAFINKTHFDRITMILRSAGFVTSDLIGGRNAVNFAYILYLRGRAENLPAADLERLVRRWYVTSILRGRYTGSPETALISTFVIIIAILSEFSPVF